jgi:transcriptional regulator with XRE-family HTH domain
MPHAAAGLKIRETRRAMGMRQNELARRVGISASYLNLIERDRRSIGGTLLAAIGRELRLSIDELDGSSERRLRDQLESLAEDQAVGALDMRDGSADALIARYPAWARGAARAYAAYRGAEAEAEALADRLANDPALAEALHEMLTEITALRSTVEILAEPRAIEPAQRLRFEGIVNEQSARLVRTGRAMVAHFDRMAEARLPRSAAEEAEEFLHRSGAGEAVEAAGARLRAALTEGGRDLEGALAALVPARLAAAEPEWGRTRRVAALAEAHAAGVAVEEIEAAVAACSPATAPHVRGALVRRLADAIRWPAEEFRDLAGRLRWDLDALAAAADGDGALVFRRTADLHRSGRRAGLVSADASGRTLARSGALDLLPRARELECPVWPLHRASGAGTLGAVVALSGGGMRRVVARARPDGMARDMLVFDPEPLDGAGAALPVGTSCRICAHRDCRQRREPSVIES